VLAIFYIVTTFLSGHTSAQMFGELAESALGAGSVQRVVDFGVLLAPVWFAEALLTPEVSIGIAISPAVAADNLLRCPDTAMYVAKSRRESVTRPAWTAVAPNDSPSSQTYA
jgi:GGDEF domain-containing protein